LPCQVHPDAANRLHQFVLSLKDAGGVLRCGAAQASSSAAASHNLFGMDIATRKQFPLFADRAAAQHVSFKNIGDGERR
jgi:hypothetical protein